MTNLEGTPSGARQILAPHPFAPRPYKSALKWVETERKEDLVVVVLDRDLEDHGSIPNSITNSLCNLRQVFWSWFPKDDLGILGIILPEVCSSELVGQAHSTLYGGRAIHLRRGSKKTAVQEGCNLK